MGETSGEAEVTFSADHSGRSRQKLDLEVD